MDQDVTVEAMHSALGLLRLLRPHRVEGVAKIRVGRLPDGGYVMLDHFIYGDMERISPEAPFPVLRLRSTWEMLGGAGDVACNVAVLGRRAVLAGLVGRDDAGNAVRRILAGMPGVVSATVDTDARPTGCKTQFIAARQQVVRADDESHDRWTGPQRTGSQPPDPWPACSRWSGCRTW